MRVYFVTTAVLSASASLARYAARVSGGKSAIISAADMAGVRVSSQCTRRSSRWRKSGIHVRYFSLS